MSLSAVSRAAADIEHAMAAPTELAVATAPDEHEAVAAANAISTEASFGIEEGEVAQLEKKWITWCALAYCLHFCTQFSKKFHAPARTPISSMRAICACHAVSPIHVRFALTPGRTMSRKTSGSY